MFATEQIHLRVASKIRSKRQKIGLSQESLADECGLHRTYIGAIERGERNITINTLAKIADALGCSVVDLIGGD
jgi:transcriptional regulator with XRE-family HTH domain